MTSSSIIPSVAGQSSVATKKTHVCKHEGCTYSTTSRGNFFRHKRVHTKYSVSCQTCAKVYRSAYDLKEHISSVHSNSLLLCEFCSKSFTNRQTLRRHIHVVHTKKYRYQCQVCGERFIEKAWFLGHMNKHTQDKPYKCNLCNKAFGYKSSYSRHIKTWHGTKTYTCDICSLEFNNQALLNTHVQGKHGAKNFSCNCGKSFSWKSSFFRHQKKCKIIHG